MGSGESITGVRRVIEIGGDDVRYGMDLNAFLGEGWILLKVLTERVDSDLGSVERPNYVLGWTGTEDPPSLPIIS